MAFLLLPQVRQSAGLVGQNAQDLPVAKAQEKNWRRGTNSFFFFFFYREGKVSKSLHFQFLMCTIPSVCVSHSPRPGFVLDHLPGSIYRVLPVPSSSESPPPAPSPLHHLCLNILPCTFPTCAFFSFSIFSCAFLACILPIDISSSTPSPTACPPSGSSPEASSLHHPHLQGSLLHPSYLPSPHVPLLHLCCGLAPVMLGLCMVHPLHLSNNLPSYYSKDLARPQFRGSPFLISQM